MSILGALALGAGSGVAQAGVGYFANKALAEQQQKYYEKNQKMNLGLQMQAQKMSALNQQQGLRLAGLSPALASEGHFSAPASPTSPLGSSAVSMSDVNFAQAKLALAEAKKAESESANIDIQNKRMGDEDATHALNTQQFFEKLQKQALERGDVESASRFEDYAKVASSKGSLVALHDYFEMADDAQLYELHQHEYELTKKVIDYQYMNGIWLDLARMPRTERQQASALIRQIGAQIENLKTDTAGKKVDIELSNEQIEQIKLINKKYKNSDLNTMVAEGRWKDAAKYIFINALGSLASTGVEAGKEAGLKKMPVKIQHVE